MEEVEFTVPTVVPVFPLPGVVLFPNVAIPLHLFEPRYRQMAADCVAGDGYLALALLRPGFEPLYYTRKAPIHPTVCVGKILASEKLKDDTYNILLQGVVRGRVVEELEGAPYRIARLEIRPGVDALPASLVDAAREHLEAAACAECAVEPKVAERWKKLFAATLELGTLTDLIASDLPAGSDYQQALLHESNPVHRARMLTDSLTCLAAQRRVRQRQINNHNFHAN